MKRWLSVPWFTWILFLQVARTLLKRNPSSLFTPVCLKGWFSIEQDSNCAFHEIKGKTPISFNRSTRGTQIHNVPLNQSQNPALLFPCLDRLMLHCLDRELRDRDIQTNARQFPTFCYTSEGPKILNESWAVLHQIYQVSVAAYYIWSHRRRQIACDGQRLGELWKFPSSLLFE